MKSLLKKVLKSGEKEGAEESTVVGGETDTSMLTPGDDDADGIEIEAEVYEHQRYDADNGWSHENLMSNDPKRYLCCGEMSKEFPDVPINPNWCFTGEW
jgi:hypothetical protein